MNGWKSNFGGNVSVLKIHASAAESESPIPVEVTIVRIDCLEERDLPAPLSRTRCGQEARQTVEPAPRQVALVDA